MKSDLHRQRVWGTIVFVAWRGGSTLAFAGLLGFNDHPILALWWVVGSALVFALLALNGVIELEKRFPETD
jgi:hypothetical protein